MTARPASAPVLVVEDDRDLREVLAEALRLEGYEVVEAVDGMDALERLRAGVRPALILFSDGNDTISLRSRREAMDAVMASGALIYAVDLGASPNASEGRPFLRWVSDATGGRYFSVRDGAATVLKAVLDDLRASYVVTYELPNRQTGFHSLRLLPTHNLNLRFHNRSGYYYEKSVR